MPRTDLSPEQEAVLESIAKNRLTVVRAGPGSGKTRVFVEALKRFIEAWQRPRQGIAALSFTNVAQEVITERLGGPPGSPHFVGTIDSFLLHFVVRPFGRLTGVSTNGAFLVPAQVVNTLSEPVVKFGPSAYDQAPIYRFDFSGGDEATPMMRCHKDGGQRVKVPAQFVGAVLCEKRRVWRTSGRMTHSDSHFLAASLLRGRFREQIVDMVVRRFPVILVDEFQDTGWFLSRALLELLRSDRVRGAVVGDPDQAIYQFGGANPGIFDQAERLHGATKAGLTTSYRCSYAVAKVASSLSRTGRVVVPKNDAPVGKALLVIHEQTSVKLDVGSLLRVCHDQLNLSALKEVAILARRRSWTQRIVSGDGIGKSCPWQTGAIRGIFEAVQHLSSGEPVLAARTAQNVLTRLVFDDDAMPRVVLREHLARLGAAEGDWRKAVHSILMEAARSVDRETWNDWVARLKGVVGQVAARIGWTRDGRKLGSTFKARYPDGDEQRFSTVSLKSATGLMNSEVMTVHGAKGREFDGVVIVVPKPHATNAPCPSIEWWSNEPDAEEREIAFVACSRAKSALVLAIHENTLKELQKSQAQFVSLFEVAYIPKSGKSPPKEKAIHSGDPV